jgi:hypothetical protein
MREETPLCPSLMVVLLLVNLATLFPRGSAFLIGLRPGCLLGGKVTREQVVAVKVAL